MTAEEQQNLVDRLKAGERVFFGYNQELTPELAARLLDQIGKSSGETLSRAQVISHAGAGVLVWIEAYSGNPIDQGFLR